MNAASATVENHDEQGIYSGAFWLAYAANVLLVCANSLTFRFAEYVHWMGGTEDIAGRIVSLGLMAAVVIRLWLGQAIDRYGTRSIWLVSSLVFIVGGVGFLLPNALAPYVQKTWILGLPGLAFARIAYQVGLAGMFSCSIVHIQNQVPAHRRTEVIGSLGSSGFVGTILGTQLSDLLFQLPSLKSGDLRFYAMFGGAALLGFLHMLVVFALTRDEEHRAPAETPAALRLLVRYWPGPIVFVAMAMGTSFSVTTVFLTRFATHAHLRGIGTFFLGYSLTAFACRWLTRQWGETVGRHRMVLYGLGGLGLGQALFPIVTTDWLFLLPALSCGFGHSLLFPAVVSLGAGAFPVHYRGSGTTLVLGFTELGTIISAPLLGLIIVHGNAVFGGGVGFSLMFATASAVATIVALAYALTAARRPDADLILLEPEPAASAIAGTPSPILEPLAARSDERTDDPAPALSPATGLGNVAVVNCATGSMTFSPVPASVLPSAALLTQPAASTAAPPPSRETPAVAQAAK